MGQRFPTTALPISVSLRPTAYSDTIGLHSESELVKNQKRVSRIYHPEGNKGTRDSKFRRWKDGTKGELPTYVPLVGGGGGNLYHPLRSFLYSLCPPFIISFSLFFCYFSSSIVVHILYVNAVNAPLSRRFEEQLTLLCSTFCFFTRHFDLLFDVPFAAKCSGARRRRPSRSIHFSQ